MIETNRAAIILLRTDLLRHLTHTEALFINQLDYYLDASGHLVDGHYWYRNTERDWALQLGVSVRQVGRAIEHLIELGLIERARVNRHSYDRTWSYRICYEQLTALTGCPARHRRMNAPKPTAPPKRVNTARIIYEEGRPTERERAEQREYVAALEAAYADELDAAEPAPDFRTTYLFSLLSPDIQAKCLQRRTTPPASA